MWKDTVEFTPDDDKLKELVLYIARQAEGDEAFGVVKLNKILFVADFEAYLVLGRPITGQEYCRLPYGPAPRRGKRILQEMEQAGDLDIREGFYHTQWQRKPIARREPDLSRFTGAEIKLADDVLAAFREHNATDISTASHEFVGWRLAEEQETIPYNAVLLDRRPPTPEEVEYGRSLEPLAQEALARYAAQAAGC